MTRVLVVHHDIDVADFESDLLQRAGYEVVECVGPTGSPQPCPALRNLPCSFADRADVFVYDVWAGGANAEGERLIEHLRIQYPEKPVVLTSPGLSPGWEELADRLDVTVLEGAPQKGALLQAIEEALGKARTRRAEAPVGA